MSGGMKRRRKRETGLGRVRNENREVRVVRRSVERKRKYERLSG